MKKHNVLSPISLCCNFYLCENCWLLTSASKILGRFRYSLFRCTCFFLQNFRSSGIQENFLVFAIEATVKLTWENKHRRKKKLSFGQWDRQPKCDLSQSFSFWRIYEFCMCIRWDNIWLQGGGPMTLIFKGCPWISKNQSFDNMCQVQAPVDTDVWCQCQQMFVAMCSCCERCRSQSSDRLSAYHERPPCRFNCILCGSLMCCRVSKTKNFVSLVLSVMYVDTFQSHWDLHIYSAVCTNLV